MEQDNILKEEEFAEVIDSIHKQEFDSHDFIRDYIAKFATSYGHLLVKHGNANTAHGEIANFLKSHATKLGIVQLERPSFTPNIFNNIRECESWQKQ